MTISWLQCVGCIGIIFVSVSDAQADKVCLKAQLRSGRPVLSRRIVGGTVNCPRGFTEVVNAAGLTGPQGPTGAVGATGAIGATGATGATGSSGTDGALRVWGNGSSGVATPTDGATLDSNGQYTDINILAGRTVSVLSGSVIRCTGTLTVSGTLRVQPNGLGGFIESTADTLLISLMSRSASLGSSAISAPNGAVRIGLGAIAGASNSLIGRPDNLRNLLRVRPGDGGGAGGGVLGAEGAPGGGAVSLFCKNGVSVPGVIRAEGFGVNQGFSGGGGAGGIVVVASNGVITVAGSIDVGGGLGGATTSSVAPSGGGAGGLIHLLAPTINVTGPLFVEGGTGGAGGVDGTLSGATLYGSGAAGGSLVSYGGNGGRAFVGGSASNGLNGNAGSAVQTLVTTTELEALLL